jgi:FAD/FMN-containing dehydrogenase
MVAQTSVNTNGAVVEAAAVRELQASLRGQLIQPGDPSYDAARQVFNAMIDRRPALIARCAGAADAIAAVRFAREHRILVSVKGGAHNFPGNSVCDGGLVIDFSALKGIRVDPRQQVARAEPGVKWGEFDRETQAFGLATTGGTFSDTGIAGLTLGGGVGWLGGTYGLASDNLVAADVVTAEGRLVTANAQENADLLWGLRGGGGNFGVVTSFEYRLHPVGPVLAGLVVHPFARAKELLRFYRDFTTETPDELSTMYALLTGPDGAPMAGIAACYNGPLEEGERVLRPLRAFGPPVADQIGLMPYTAVQSMVDALGPPGRHHYAKSPWVREITDGLIDAVAASFAEVTSPHSMIVLQQKDGEMARGPHDRTAFGHRDDRYSLVLWASWADPRESDRHVGWLRGLAQAVALFTAGGDYVNDMGLATDEGAERIKAGFGANYARLVALKDKYDPTNLFRHNQNIRPTEWKS